MHIGVIPGTMTWVPRRRRAANTSISLHLRSGLEREAGKITGSKRRQPQLHPRRQIQIASAHPSDGRGC